MCQLAYIDFKEGYYPSPLFVKWLMTADSLEGHRDGFGFFLESRKEIYKSKLSAVEWFVKNYYDSFSRLRNTNGIYHVRRASVKMQPDEIKDEHAHPFRLGNLVVAHNGTLDLQGVPNDPAINKDLFTDDLIDSQKFLIVLSHYYTLNKSILDEKVIRNAINEFSGSYVFLIRDISTKDLFVVKDETKDLSKVSFFKDGEIIGNIFNTRYYQLDLLSEIYLDTHPEVGATIAVVPKETISKYTIGKYDSFIKLGEIRNPLKRYKATHVVAKDSGTIHVGVQQNASSTVRKEESSLSFFDVASECFLALEDMLLLYELLFSKSVLRMSAGEIEKLSDVILKIKKDDWTEKRSESLKGVLELYGDGIVTSPAFDFANEFEQIVFNYPLICNGKDKLDESTTYLKDLYL